MVLRTGKPASILTKVKKLVGKGAPKKAAAPKKAVAPKKAAAPKSAAAPKKAAQAQEMSLEEKMQLFRSKQNPKGELPPLTTAQQKQLSSKFKYAQSKADEEVQSQYSAAMSASSKGQKHQTHQQFVKAWILEPSFNDKYMKIIQELVQIKSYITKEAPVSYKQLQQKYSDLV